MITGAFRVREGEERVKASFPRATRVLVKIMKARFHTPHTRVLDTLTSSCVDQGGNAG